MVRVMSELIALRFDPVEDRLALRISSANGEERIVHLTRRFTRLLATALERIAAETAGSPADSEAGQRSNLAALHHEAIAAQTRIEFRKARGSPQLRDQLPLLATGVRTGRKKSTPVRWMLELTCQGQRRIMLTLSTRMLHGFIDLLRRHLPETDWGIELLAAPRDDAHRSLMH